jgi:hypothetical protein
MLAAPWNFVGLGIAIAILIGVTAGLGVVVSKLGFGPAPKPMPESGVKQLEEQARIAAEEAEARRDELAARPEPKKWGRM